jgi:hypothetical protein
MVAYLHEPNLANSNPNKQWSEAMKDLQLTLALAAISLLLIELFIWRE